MADSIDLPFQAETAIVQYALVSTNVFGRLVHCDWPLTEACSNVIGIALTSATPGEIIQVRHLGIIDNPGWNFIINKPVYANYNGSISQEIPLNSIVKIGKAVGQTRLFVKFSDLLALRAQ